MGKRGNNKKPVNKHEPKAVKSPKILKSPDSLANKLFKWRVGWADLDGYWGWNKITHEQLFRDVITKLHNFESMTWHEIFVKTKKQHHPVEVSKLLKKAQKRLLDLEKDDWSELYSIKIGGTLRIWGMKDGQYFQVLWWDPKHEICPSKLKHT